MSEIRIPFNRPYIIGKELSYILESIEQGQLSGDGPFTKRCHTLLEHILGVPKVLLTTSCTHALEMSAILLNIKPGDEVIVPSFTFVSTINAFVIHGARPIFADIKPDTLNLDETKIEKLINSRTKAIVPVHYAGVGCEMDPILDIAGQHDIPVVEDNAHGLFGKYKGQWLGTFGCMATQSFHETKNITCGEGGALLINEPNYIERAEIIREKGTNRSLFFRGQIDKYSWVDIGSSYLPSDILAAFLYAQLARWEQIQEKRKKIWDYYHNNLKDWAEEQEVKLPFVPDHCEQAYHMFYMLMPSLEQRQALITYLRNRNIMAVFHYLPLHLSKMGQGFAGNPKNCPITQDVSNRLVRIPFYNGLTEDDQACVVEAITDFNMT
jgi:dTDP-4-amino-4,6-dideoxygalactose transaminase